VNSQFPGVVTSVDVVNEPLNEASTGLRKHIWQQTVPRYIIKAFNAAHEAFPDAKLCMNDWGLENTPDRMELMYNMVKGLKDKGVPMDCLGMEYHIDEVTDAPRVKLLNKYIPMFRAIGVDVRISELDVNGDNEIWQANMYGQIFAYARAHNIKEVSLWGTKTGTGATYEHDDDHLAYYNSLPWNLKGKPRLAVSFIQQALK
jgi:endo-1,4-beta-xylanase